MTSALNPAQTTPTQPNPHSNNGPLALPGDIGLLKRTKIIATLGPASADAETLKQLAHAGINVFRLNLSHGDIEEQLARVRMIRAVSAELNMPLAVLADLQGPKLRTGHLLNNQPIPLADYAVVAFTTRTRESSPGVVSTKYGELITALEPGALILLDDGKIRLEVLEKVDDETLKCQVVQGGLLDARKGINVPGTILPITALTDKDKEDARAVVAEGVDYIALSFVQRPQDITELRDYLAGFGLHCPPVIAKIEKPQALKEIDGILDVADGLMVARGDLGVELRPEEVPVAQKQLVAKANAAEKPVIIATQMLESMIHSVQPSRSDVSDIANAVFDGSDALMLSGETSVGDHPVETVAMMSRIIHEAEKSIFAIADRHGAGTAHEASLQASPNFYQAIAHTASYACRKANVKALVVFSNSGSMAQRISKQKPARPIIALTPKPEVYQRMSLLWGVTPVIIPASEHTDTMLENGEQAIFEKNLLQKGDSVVFCAGNTQMRGATNMLKIYHLGETN